MITETITPGSHRDFPIQCWTQSGIRAVYAQGDTLSAGIYRTTTDPVAAPIGTASATWYTDPIPGTTTPRQTGYDEGQVVGTILSADSAKLVRLMTVYLRLFRTMAADPSETEEIATVQLKVQ